MSLPQTIDPSKPAIGDYVYDGDNELRNLKQFTIDVLGVPNTTQVSAAAMSILSGGAITLTYPTYETVRFYPPDVSNYASSVISINFLNDPISDKKFKNIGQVHGANALYHQYYPPTGPWDKRCYLIFRIPETFNTNKKLYFRCKYQHENTTGTASGYFKVELTGRAIKSGEHISTGGVAFTVFASTFISALLSATMRQSLSFMVLSNGKFETGDSITCRFRSVVFSAAPADVQGWDLSFWNHEFYQDT